MCDGRAIVGVMVERKLVTGGVHCPFAALTKSTLFLYYENSFGFQLIYENIFIIPSF